MRLALILATMLAASAAAAQSWPAQPVEEKWAGIIRETGIKIQ